MKSPLAPMSASAVTVAYAALLLTPLPGPGNHYVSASDNFPYPKPTFRFESFDKLDPTSQNIAEVKLGYLDVTWNVHGLAPIESTGWTSLTTTERDSASQLGFTEPTWDCFVNHYEDNDWDTLTNLGVHVYYMGLGWTRSHWDGSAEDVPHTESRWWDMLTDNEKKAANGLCYFRDNWDKVDMNPNESYFPHPVPTFRYRPWDELDAVTATVAGGMLNYTEDRWDNLGQAVPEKNTFLNLDEDERAGALELGFYTHTWDCFMNHYLSYYWSSFHTDLKVAIETLGWTEDMWTGDSGVVPASEGTMWGALTPQERAAATRLCYFRETWDEEPLTRWYDYDTGEPSPADTGEGPVPDDIALDIFDETGYAGKDPKTVGVPSAALIEPRPSSSSSYYHGSSLVSSSSYGAMMAMALTMGVHLLLLA